MAENEVVAVKRDLVGLMIAVPPVLQVQLGEAISIIAESDFWQRWDTLIDVGIFIFILSRYWVLT
jgi:exportin-2 (importin alpha re-exporter)